MNSSRRDRHHRPSSSARTRREGNTTIVRADSDAEMLALIPRLLGSPPRESLVMVPFIGSRCGAGVRIDLPPVPTEEVMEHVAALIVSMLSRIPRCDSVVIAAFTSAGFADTRDTYTDALHGLERSLHRQGFGIRKTLIRAGDGWAEIDDERAPATGHPLSRLEDALPAGLPEDPDRARTADRHRGKLPRRDDERARRLAEDVELLSRGLETTGLGLTVPATDVDVVRLVEELVAHGPDRLTSIAMARFCIKASMPVHRDVMMVQLAFGEATGRSAQRHNDRHQARMRSTGLSSDELAVQEIRKGGGADREVSMILGDWPEAPDPDRLHAAQDAVAQIAAHCPSWVRPPVLCILGWLCWAAGGGSAAGEHLTQALKLDPGLRMASLLLTLVSTGKLPEWGFRYLDRVVGRPDRRSDRRSERRRRAA
jgi:hypothetical protein